jgi:acetyl esterase/lipase
MGLAYGSDEAQFGEFHRGREPSRRTAVVVIHGGFWRARRSLRMTTACAAALAGRGWHVWNVEYRRGGRGGWRAPLEDCAAAIDHLAVIGRRLDLELGPAIVLGHSAGGQLAMWAGGRAAAGTGVKAVVSVAGILDMAGAARAGTGDDAVVELLGGRPGEVPDRYREADPMRRLPAGVTVRCLHSRADERVPFEQSLRFVQAARRAGDDAQLVEVDGAHADGIDPRTPAGARVAAVLDALDEP